MEIYGWEERKGEGEGGGGDYCMVWVLKIKLKNTIKVVYYVLLSHYIIQYSITVLTRQNNEKYVSMCYSF